ncbi:zinc finger protein 91-like [Pectinophora gossypiella]|uniref:zinc finger protein 91-like n=1 Tax=Pectinophora gossypiella TaxID=13191 RepID=UPI00214F1823|nr:zinc finger protein 91-like [Pectinophora gossypiella]
MMTEPPLVLCMENVNGEEVSLQIEPGDDFHTFLLKAKSLLGYDVDINSITRNHPVTLSDNVYKFLLNTEQSLTNDLNEPILPTVNAEDLYILDDGTQIRASQIHFDNEDPPVDLTAERIPFIKYNDVIDDSERIEDCIEVENKIYNIVESPVRFNKDNGSSFVIPFKLVSNNTSGFEAQFTKFLETNTKTYATLNPVVNRNKSPRSLIRDNYKNYDDNFQSHRRNDEFTHYTREEILNMFKDSPVASLPYDNQGFTEKRRHVRKSDPSRLVHKNWTKPISYVDVDGVLIAESESQNCFICDKYVDNNLDKLYLFDNEDQRLHRSSPQKKLSTQLKIICEQCLEENFKPCRMKSPNQSLNPDEYLVIKNNQQYIFQKINSLNFNVYKKFSNNKMESSFYKKDEKSEFVKVEIGSDGEIVAQPLQKDDGEVIVVKDERKDSSSDVEIIENGPEIDDNILDNLEEADDDVKEFLGKYQCDSDELKELKCRFCEKVFSEVSEVMDHGETHKHVLDDGEVFPCPLCDYGYANFKWLKGHLKAAHCKDSQVKTEDKEETDKPADEDKKDTETGSPKDKSSPIASRTRSAVKNVNGEEAKEPPEKSEKPEDTQQSSIQSESGFVIKTEVKQECLDSSDDEIWIVQTADDEADKQLKILLDAAKNDKDDGRKKYRCDSCSQVFISSESLSVHKCRRRGRKRKPSKDESVICVPTKEDFIKRAQGRLRNVDVDSGDNDLLIVRPRKRKNKEPTSDPQIVTCHDCNESFTSKVRLKFHMQFHDTTSMLSPTGEYTCPECENTTFPTETALFDHVHFQHHKQRRWQCPVAGCGKTFYLRATLTKHSRTHTDTRRYVCGTCGKRFLDKQTLDEHGVTHLQIKPFQCHICLKQLTRRSRLRMHLRAHEEELCPRLVLVCAVCERAFRDPQHVQEHVTRSPECIEEFANELKEEEAVTVQLSPTSGLVRHTVQIVESPKLSKPIRREAYGAAAEALLSRVADAARPIIRCVEIEKAFRCEYCEDVFYSESGLNNHRVIHKGVKNPFTCHICKVSFATYSRCTTHKTTHGFYKRSLADAKKRLDTATPQAGPSCTGILGYGDFPVVKHFLCEDCGRSYLHWTYLQVHRRMKHANENFLYKCNQCELSFPNSWSLSYHRKKVHGKVDQDENTNNKTAKEKDDFKIPCRDCDEVLPNKTALYKHRKKEHSDMSLRNNSKLGVFWCYVCGRRYGSRAGLEAHARTHATQAAHGPHAAHAAHAAHATQPHAAQAACGKCNHTFRDIASLHAHLKEVHGHEVDFTCSVCKKSFNTRTELSCHARGHATRAHACHVCGHAFRTLSMLTEHARVHTGERPFPCDVCGVAFRRSTAMRNHRLIHSGVRAWACAVCGRRFRIRSDLRTHLRLKHPARLLVIEVSGLNPSPEEVMERLTANKIPHDKVIEITKMSFPKGTSSIIPNSSRALDMLSHVPRTQVAASRSRPERPFELFQPARRGRGIAKNPRKPKILQRGDPCTLSDKMYSINNLNMTRSEVQQGDLSSAPQVDPTAYPVALNVSGEELRELNVQLVLRDGVLVGGEQMVTLQLTDEMMME